MVVTGEKPFGNVGRQQMKRTSDPGGGGYYNFCGAETWSPPVNLYETDLVYIACVDLAGVDKEKIDVEVDGSTLTIRGHREVPWVAPKHEGEGRPRVHVMEIDHGSFCRNVELPQNALQEQISATYRDGLLWIEIPKQ